MFYYIKQMGFLLKAFRYIRVNSYSSWISLSDWKGVQEVATMALLSVL